MSSVHHFILVLLEIDISYMFSVFLYLSSILKELEAGL
jgi:hypothetical protein